MDVQNTQPDEVPAEDVSIAARLQQLGAMPVDTSRLERAIRAEIGSPSRTNAFRNAAWLRPLRAVAAIIAVAALLIALFQSTSGGPVLASTSEMAQFHEDLVSGKMPAMKVDSVDAANRALAAQWKQSPQIPNMPEDHAMACCMRSVKNKKVACVLLKGDGQPVTMTVANAADMQMPNSPAATRNGIEYHIQSSGSLNMVMTERDGRWICLIAQLPSDRLMDLASSLQF